MMQNSQSGSGWPVFESSVLSPPTLAILACGWLGAPASPYHFTRKNLTPNLFLQFWLFSFILCVWCHLAIRSLQGQLMQANLIAPMDHSEILLKTLPLSNIKLILFSLSFPFSAVFFSAPLILQTAPSSFVSPADNSKYTQKGEQASRRAGFIQKGHHEFCLVWIGWVLRLFWIEAWWM